MLLMMDLGRNNYGYSAGCEPPWRRSSPSLFHSVHVPPFALSWGTITQCPSTGTAMPSFNLSLLGKEVHANCNGRLFRVGVES